MVAAAALILGGLLSLGIDALGAPEALLRFLYDTLLSGLDVPDEPSQTAVDIVRWFARVGGLLELSGGAVLLAVAIRRGPLR
jgi:hypothetical protein